MDDILDLPSPIDENMSCFGNFDSGNKVCNSRCVLCLKCIIERDKNIKVEIIEEMMAAEFSHLRLQ